MRAKMVSPFAVTSTSSLFIVSFGPYALSSVINPSAAITCAPHRNIAASKAKILPPRRES
jgi:hypothetical protein